MNPFAAALDVIATTFGESVGYDGAGLSVPTDIMVVWSDVAAEPFMGAGSTARTVSCEIRRGKLPARPAKTDVITRSGVRWSPIDIREDDAIDSWVLVLERAA